MPFVVLGLWMSLASAQGPAAVNGHVLDAATRAPVPDARVVLTRLDEAGDPIAPTSRTAQTDVAGRFGFPDVVSGPYVLAVSTVGYLYVRRRLDVEIGVPIDLIVPLAEGAGTYEEHVTVTADVEREAVPRAAVAHVLGPAALQELRGVATDDPMRAVQALSGVATGDDFQAGFSVRGAPFRQAGVIIDGLPAGVLLHAVRDDSNSGSIAMLNTDVLSRASLAVGARAARDGDWLGATLEFDLREGSRDRAATRSAVSGTSASIVTEGPIGRDRRSSWIVSIRKSYLDWLVRKVEPDFDSTLGFWDGHAKIVADLGSRDELQLLVIGGDAEYHGRDAASVNRLVRAHSGSTLAAVSWRHAADGWISRQRVYFLGSEFRNTGRVSQVLTRGYSQAVGWRGEVGVPRGRWLVEAGGAAERLRASQTLRTFATSADDTLRTLDERETGPALWSGAAWVEASRTGATGTVALGLRRGARSDVARGTWSPWIVAERRAGRLTVRAGAAGSAQFTDPLTALAARERPSAERASSYDVGVVQTISPTIEWAVTAFARREGDVLRSVGEDRLDATTGEFVGALPFPASSAVLEGRVRGADVVLRRRAASGLTGWASYTWAHARARDVATGERFDADFDQRHTLNVVASQRLSYRSTIGLTFRAGSNVPLAGYFEPAGDGLRLSHARNRVRLPTYARLDARLTRTFTFARHRMTLFVEVMNVLNRRNVGPADASVRRSLEVTGFAERLIPRVPSAGLLVEF